MSAAELAPPVPSQPQRGMGFKTFVGFIAALMAVNALAIDSMLPALPHIGESLGIRLENDRQWIITAYLLGFGVAQIFYGALADRFGRRPILLVGLALYVAFSALAAFATSFELMMTARVLQGVGAAATRVLAVSIVRDRYSGRQMARVMSLSFIVFLAVPILAPSLGQLLMLVGPWRLIFGGLAAFGGAVLLWAYLRLPETQHPEDRAPMSVASLTRSLKATLTDRIAIGYTLAMTVIFGGLFGFINTAQQLFVDVFKAPGLFTIVFAGVAAFMAVSSLLNSRLVERLGTRLISHSALIGFTVLSFLHAAVAITGHETIWTFAAFQAATMFCFGLVAGNFGSMAMEPLGHVAGMAASVQGLITTVGGALIGFFIGQHFNGTAIPLTLGFAACGLGGLVIVFIAEKGKLFKARHGASAPGEVQLH